MSATRVYGRLAGAMAAAAMLIVVARNASAQGDIATRVSNAPDGSVRMTFAARPGVCGDGYWGNGGHGVRWSEDVEWSNACPPGQVHVAITIRDHTPASLGTYVGGVWRQPRPGQVTTDLGTVSAKEAASYLVGLVRRSQSSVARDAILPATLADSAIIWPDLAAIAKDVGRPTDVRKQAVFWLGQAAADVTGSLDSLASNDEAGREVREQAVFALSQRPKEEGVPMLIKIAQTNHDPEVRRKALFWLGQSDDPRAIALFEAILLDARR